ncbi:TPR end-of-group domain-containing protein [Candidatus Laterigemmans baculatus]|nr:tetratricopeptide repeat protein [Candidatus Laterigemmans baculatus]
MISEYNTPRVLQRQRIREAEGLLELATGPAARLGLRPALRRRLARRALALVVRHRVGGDDAWRRDLVIGQALRLCRNYTAAIGPLWSAVSRNPDSREAWIALGWCLKRMGEIDRAAAVLAQAVEMIPDDALLHFNFACYLGRLGQAEMAVSELLWAFDLNPDLRARIDGEPDFDPIRLHASFRALTQLPV